MVVEHYQATADAQVAKDQIYALLKDRERLVEERDELRAILQVELGKNIVTLKSEAEAAKRSLEAAGEKEEWEREMEGVANRRIAQLELE